MDGAQPTDSNDAGWKYSPTDAVVSPAPAATPLAQPSVEQQPGISWTASEFVAHHKTGGWYALLAGGAVMAAIVVFLVTKDVVSAVVILLAAIAFGIVAARQPRELQYQVDNYGLVIGVKEYNYSAFRSFSVVQEGAFSSIVFMPLKRFASLVTIYYDPADEADIVELLSQHLPLEKRDQAAIDRLMWRIRF